MSEVSLLGIADLNEGNIRKQGFEQIKEIGGGAYGVVYEARCGNDWCAIKCVKNTYKALQECEIMSSLKHENIVEYKGYFTDASDAVGDTLTVQMFGEAEEFGIQQGGSGHAEGDGMASGFHSQTTEYPDGGSILNKNDIHQAARQLGINLIQPNGIEEERSELCKEQEPKEVNTCLDVDEEVPVLDHSRHSAEEKQLSLSKSKDVIHASDGDYRGQPDSGESSLYIVMELCDMTLSVMFEVQKPDRKQWKDMYINIVNAIDFCHSKKIVHGDLEAKNIFIKNKVPKVGDFGNAKRIEDEDLFRYQASVDICALAKLAVFMLINPKSDITKFCKAIMHSNYRAIFDPDRNETTVQCIGEKYPFDIELFDKIKNMLCDSEKYNAKQILDWFNESVFFD